MSTGLEDKIMDTLVSLEYHEQKLGRKIRKTDKDFQYWMWRLAHPDVLNTRYDTQDARARRQDKLKSAVEGVLQVLKEERLTIHESHIVLGRATRQLLEIDISIAGVRA